jgi:hypothetical protein
MTNAMAFIYVLAERVIVCLTTTNPWWQEN